MSASETIDRVVHGHADVQISQPRGRSSGLLPYKLHKQIDWLDEHRVITPRQKEWANAVRCVGNERAHDNSTDDDVFVTGVGRDDALATIELAEGRFHALYESNAAAQAQLAKRGKLKP